MSDTRRYQVSYFVTSYWNVYVDRPVDITEEELLNSITRDDLSSGEETGGWDGLKLAWRNGDVSLILDDEGEEIEFPT